MTFKQILLEIIGGRNRKRFPALVYLLRGIAQKSPWPLSPPVKRIVDALYCVEHFNRCVADIDLRGAPFYFDLLRMTFDDVMSLVDRIHARDCYGLGDLDMGDPVVIDAGAHLGIFSRYVMAECPNARLYALEPDRENHELLRKNLESFENTHCFQKGLFETKDTLELYTSRRIDWRTTLDPSGTFRESGGFGKGEFTSSYTVEVVDLDTFMREEGIERLDLLKVSIPGELEDRVLRGARRSIEKFRPRVSIITYPKNVDAVREFFQDMGNYEEDPRGTGNIRLFKPTCR